MTLSVHGCEDWRIGVRPDLKRPPAFFMPYSHHSHSGQFCKHAVGTLEEVVLEAIQQGFEVFGLTEHVPRYRVADLYPEEVPHLILRPSNVAF